MDILLMLDQTKGTVMNRKCLSIIGGCTLYSSLKRPVPFFPLLRMQQTGSSELFSSTHIQSPNSKIKTFVLGFI